MPMLELFAPAGALAEGDGDQLMGELTRTLLRWEGAPESPQALELSWAYLHETRPERTYHRGAPIESNAPHFRLMVTVPQGALDDERKAGLVAEATEQIRRASGYADPSAAARVWVIVTEVTDGNWGGAGRIWRLRDIARFVKTPDARAEEAAAALGRSA
jgi:phenylpyruvate tautomerase PptA (4-oxalocrotonate tautomerase family)